MVKLLFTDYASLWLRAGLNKRQSPVRLKLVRVSMWERDQQQSKRLATPFTRRILTNLDTADESAIVHLRSALQSVSYMAEPPPSINT